MHTLSGAAHKLQGRDTLYVSWQMHLKLGLATLNTPQQRVQSVEAEINLGL